MREKWHQITHNDDDATDNGRNRRDMTDPQPKTVTIPIDLITADSAIQPRAALSEQALADYQEIYTAAGSQKPVLPPVRVFQDGSKYWLSRGFHRFTSALRAKMSSIDAEIHTGDKRKAILDAMLDNAEHGVRRTAEDKRKAVNTLLDDAEWCRCTQEEIAGMANVSLGLVRAIVAERKPQQPPLGTKSYIASSSQGGKSKPGVKGGISSVARREEVIIPVVPADEPERTLYLGRIAYTPEQLAALKAMQPGQREVLLRDVTSGVTTLAQALAKQTATKASGYDRLAAAVTKGTAHKPQAPKPAESVGEYLSRIAHAVTERVMELKATSAECQKLATYEDSSQVEIVAMIDGETVTTVAEAIARYESEDEPVTPEPEAQRPEKTPEQVARESAVKMITGIRQTIIQSRIGIDKVLAILGADRTTSDYAKSALDDLDKAAITMADWARSIR